METTIVHLCNTDFEYTLIHPLSDPLEKTWAYYPVSKQLQFLPLLYGEPEDLLAVSALPDAAYLSELQNSPFRNGSSLPKCHLLQEEIPFHLKKVESWGYSRSITDWAKARDMQYEYTLKEAIVRKIHSKSYSLSICPLPNALLIDTPAALEEFLTKVPGNKVLKTSLGFSGKGHFLIDQKTPIPSILHFCQKEWIHKRPLIGEPWVTRLLDFSTQWHIHSDGEIELLGTTLFRTSPQGQYLGTTTGPLEMIFREYVAFVREQQHIAKKAVEGIYQEGFYGHLGIDAFIYLDPLTGTPSLHPIVEINARKTMSWVALKIQKKFFPERVIHLNFGTPQVGKTSLLPSFLVQNDSERLQFKHQLFLNF